MKPSNPTTPFAPHEIRKFITPLTLVLVVVFIAIIVRSFYSPDGISVSLLTFCILGIFYIVLNYLLFIRVLINQNLVGVINVIITVFGIGMLFQLLPQQYGNMTHLLIIFGLTALATVSGKLYGRLALLGVFIITLPYAWPTLTDVNNTLNYLSPLVASGGTIELVSLLHGVANQHIRRLETINKVSRQITQSLDTKETMELLDTTIREALDIDTFFIGIHEGTAIRLEYFYDENEYFNGMTIPFDGTLSGWVIKNQKELFLPDLRNKVEIDGISDIVIGQDRTSLSWLGVPLKAENINGLLVIASYSANAFDKADLELLKSLGQHVTIALDNTIRHAAVEKSAQLDSLTGVYNHGAFLKVLQQHAEESSQNKTGLSLIMLDIDEFKNYNDTYGHLVGDRVLQALSTAIKNNIKRSDAVGRWGGEEFAISLPHATGEQAIQVGIRIAQTLQVLKVEDRNKNLLPAPTLSQGIAVFNVDASEIYELIDQADRHLYKAKEDGGDRIEPNKSYWENRP